jgi:hypothetical protein
MSPPDSTAPPGAGREQRLTALLDGWCAQQSGAAADPSCGAAAHTATETDKQNADPGACKGSGAALAGGAAAACAEPVDRSRDAPKAPQLPANSGGGRSSGGGTSSSGSVCSSSGGSSSSSSGSGCSSRGGTSGGGRDGGSSSSTSGCSSTSSSNTSGCSSSTSMSSSGSGRSRGSGSGTSNDEDCGVDSLPLARLSLAGPQAGQHNSPDPVRPGDSGGGRGADLAVPPSLLRLLRAGVPWLARARGEGSAGAAAALVPTSEEWSEAEVGPWTAGGLVVTWH